MKAPQKRWQQTFKIGLRQEKVKMITIRRTHYANPAGFYIDINGERYFKNVLEREVAETAALDEWNKKRIEQEKVL